jgi:hypothetical protein
MGADMLVTALVIDRGRQPDFAAARLAIDSIRASDIEIPDEFWDEDPDSDVGLEAIRYQLRDSLTELEAALQQSRELTWFELRGASVYLTGGLSNGDAPTQLFDTFTRLYAVPAVLVAAGFEVSP